MQAISERIPLTHGIEAARQAADGATLQDVSGLLATEAVIGIAYTLVGYAVLRFMELESRRQASLQVA
jgi:ABC-2 type transport system permease protein